LPVTQAAACRSHPRSAGGRGTASSQGDDVAGLGPIDDTQDVARGSLTVAFVVLVAVMVMLTAMFAGGAS